MKILILLTFILLMSFVTVPVRSVSSATTIVTGDDSGFVVNTGGAVTFTLGTVSAGFTTTIVNNGTGVITFSSAVTVGNGQTITQLSNSAGAIMPGTKGNSIRIFYDGTLWRGV